MFSYAGEWSTPSLLCPPCTLFALGLNGNLIHSSTLMPLPYLSQHMVHSFLPLPLLSQQMVHSFLPFLLLNVLLAPFPSLPLPLWLFQHMVDPLLPSLFSLWLLQHMIDPLLPSLWRSLSCVCPGDPGSCIGRRCGLDIGGVALHSV